MSTPGPWKVIRRRGGSSEVWSADEQSCVADRVFNDNGLLIAASPCLLAALRVAVGLLETLCGNTDDIANEVIRAGHAAVAKTKSEERHG